MALIHLQKKLIDQSRNILSDIYNQFYYYYYYYQLILSSIINYSFYTGQTIYIDINIIISLAQFRYSFVVLRYLPPPTIPPRSLFLLHSSSLMSLKLNTHFSRAQLLRTVILIPWTKLILFATFVSTVNGRKEKKKKKKKEEEEKRNECKTSRTIDQSH